MKIVSGFMALSLAMIMFTVQAYAGGWQSYTATDGSFTVRFPITPKREATSDGYRLIASPSSHVTYLVQFTQLQSSVEAKSDIVFTAVRNSLTKQGNVVLSVSRVSVGGHPGRDMEIRAPNGTYVWDRMFVMRDRLYQILRGTDTQQSAPTRFWASFALHH